VAQTGDRFGLALEPCQFRGTRIRAGEQHLKCDRTTETQVKGAEDDPNTPLTEDVLYVVTRKARKNPVLLQRRAFCFEDLSRREHCTEFSADA
jgi:hypothetical protein